MLEVVFCLFLTSLQFICEKAIKLLGIQQVTCMYHHWVLDPRHSSSYRNNINNNDENNDDNDNNMFYFAYTGTCGLS